METICSNSLYYHSFIPKKNVAKLFPRILFIVNSKKRLISTDTLKKRGEGDQSIKAFFSTVKISFCSFNILRMVSPDIVHPLWFIIKKLVNLDCVRSICEALQYTLGLSHASFGAFHRLTKITLLARLLTRFCIRTSFHIDFPPPQFIAPFSRRRFNICAPCFCLLFARSRPFFFRSVLHSDQSCSPRPMPTPRKDLFLQV